MSRLVRVYPRMLIGGAEQHILQLLRSIPNTEMVVPGVDGQLGALARAHTSRYTVVERPRLAETVRACRGADILHVHAINDDWVLGLAVQLAGARRVVLTVHNNFEASYSGFADHVFVVGVETRDILAVPGRVSVLGEGVDVPEAVAPRLPIAGRPLRFCEIRREDKEMAFTLVELVRAGALDGVDFEARVVGVSGDSGHPSIRNLGELPDPSPHLAWADVVLHGSAADTFGRTVYEALAHGAMPLATPLPAFTERLADGQQVLLAEGMRPVDGIALLQRAVQWLRAEADPEARRTANHRWVVDHASTAVMVQAQKDGYADVFAGPAAPRSIVPDDVPDAVLPKLSAILDALVYRQPLDPSEIDTLPPRARAIAYWSLAELKRAPPPMQVKLLRAAVTILGPRPALLRSLGSLLRDRGQMDDARTAFMAAIQADPHNVTPYYEMADLLLRQNAIDAARDMFQAYLRVVPDFEPAQRYLARLSAPVQQRARPFAHFRRFKRVIITGPHRSGTTIATEMIAADSGHEAVREESFEFYREDLLRDVLRRTGVIVQCPALFDLMPELSDPHTAIVLMRRPLNELAQSRDRMFDPHSAHQLSGEEQNTAQLKRLGASTGDAAALKYDAWDRWVAEGRIHHPIELEYQNLSEHPMWVAKEDRRKLGRRWHNRRTRL